MVVNHGLFLYFLILFCALKPREKVERKGEEKEKRSEEKLRRKEKRRPSVRPAAGGGVPYAPYRRYPGCVWGGVLISI